ncbi:hypothetical protein BH11PSE1_BH11PSE1_28940 [soil metagenome]
MSDHPTPAAPTPPAGHAICRCGFAGFAQPVMICTCPVHPAPTKPEAPKKPAPPAFSDQVPEAFAKGFKDVWSGVAAGRSPVGLIADCRMLLAVLLTELERRAGVAPASSRWASRFGGGAPKAGMKTKIDSLVTKGVLLKGVADLAKRISQLEPGSEVNALYPMGDPAQARDYMNLIWQVADQGFEQDRWSRTGDAPLRVVPEAKDGH